MPAAALNSLACASAVLPASGSGIAVMPEPAAVALAACRLVEPAAVLAAVAFTANPSLPGVTGELTWALNVMALAGAVLSCAPLTLPAGAVAALELATALVIAAVVAAAAAAAACASAVLDWAVWAGAGLAAFLLSAAVALPEPDTPDAPAAGFTDAVSAAFDGAVAVCAADAELPAVAALALMPPSICMDVPRYPTSPLATAFAVVSATLA